MPNINLSSVLKEFLKNTGRQAFKAGGRYKRSLINHPLKTISGTTLAGTGATLGTAALLSLADPQIGKSVSNRLLYGPKKAFQQAVSSGVQTFAQNMTKPHEKRDKLGNVVLDKSGKPVIVQGVIPRLADTFGKTMSPAFTKSFQPMVKSMSTMAQKAGQIGKSFGQNLGEGFRSSGGKVLTGAGAATLGYTLSDLLQDYFQKGEQDPKKKRKRRVLNILSAIAAGGAGTYFSDRIYNFLGSK